MKFLAALALAATAATAVQSQTPPASPPPPPAPGGAMMAADRDGDGTVTRAEAIAEAGARFAQMDADRDGTVTAAERRAYRAALRDRRIAEGRSAALPPRAGGPPAMTREAFVAMAAGRFDRIDANRDGRLDRAEIDAARPAGGRGPAHGDGSPPPPADD